jgi:hypothetical protein
VPAGYGKVAVLDELRAALPLSRDRITYVGDGSSDVQVMMHVNRLDGLTIAVSENKYINQIAQRTVLSDDALSVLVPVLCSNASPAKASTASSAIPAASPSPSTTPSTTPHPPHPRAPRRERLLRRRRLRARHRQGRRLLRHLRPRRHQPRHRPRRRHDGFHPHRRHHRPGHSKLIGSDAFQEADTFGITRSCTKHNFMVKNVQELPQIVHEAFYIAASGRPGPVLVDIPKDVFQARGHLRPSTPSICPATRSSPKATPARSAAPRS